MSLLLERIGEILTGDRIERFPIRRRFNGREIFITDLLGKYYFEGDHRAEMKRNGIEPLSINEILRALPKRQAEQGVERMVFFDTPATKTGIIRTAGNHFRVTKIYTEFGMAEIQHCSRFGDRDTDGVPSFSIGLDEKLFRGVDIERFGYKANGKFLTLIEYRIAGYQKVHEGEDVFITDKDIPGKLRKIPSIVDARFPDIHPACC